MKDIKKNRFLVWLMYAVPIACTGWFSLCIWTVVQIMMCCAEQEKRKECNVIKSKRQRIEKEEADKKVQQQVELAKQFGKKYYIVDGKVYMFDGK